MEQSDTEPLIRCRKTAFKAPQGNTRGVGLSTRERNERGEETGDMFEDSPRCSSTGVTLWLAGYEKIKACAPCLLQSPWTQPSSL